MVITRFFHKILSYIKSLFLGGLFMLLPLVATVFIITFTYTFISQWLEPLTNIQPAFLDKIPGSEFMIVTLCILVIGFIVRLFFITPIIHWFENLIKKIPVIRTIYSSAKTLVDFLNVPDPKSHARKVILIEFPRTGVYNLAFQLEEATNSFQKLIPKEKLKDGKKYYKVFMPNSPSPATGYFLILCEDEIIDTDMTFEEAIKAVVSCGLITPDSLKRL